MEKTISDEVSEAVTNLIESIDNKTKCSSHEEWLQREAMKLMQIEAKLIAQQKKSNSNKKNRAE